MEELFKYVGKIVNRLGCDVCVIEWLKWIKFSFKSSYDIWNYDYKVGFLKVFRI